MKGNVGVDVDSVGAVDEGICLVVLELMGYNLIPCEVGRKLRDVIARDLIPSEKLQI